MLVNRVDTTDRKSELPINWYKYVENAPVRLTLLRLIRLVSREIILLERRIANRKPNFQDFHRSALKEKNGHRKGRNEYALSDRLDRDEKKKKTCTTSFIPLRNRLMFDIQKEKNWKETKKFPSERKRSKQITETRNLDATAARNSRCGRIKIFELCIISRDKWQAKSCP